MAIKKIAGKGLEVELDDFVKLRAFQSGGEFWGHEHQGAIRQHLQEFLPRMEVQSDGKSVLAQHFVNGKEVASTSNPSSKGIPKSELKRLGKALANLKAKAEDENADQTTRSIIKAFRLPDPSKDPELYRVYGSRFRPKLLVVWGCEKEAGTSIVPEAVSDKIKVESSGSSLVRKSPWLLLILLFIGLGIYGAQSGKFDNLLSPSADLVKDSDDGSNPNKSKSGDPSGADTTSSPNGKSKPGDKGGKLANGETAPEGSTSKPGKTTAPGGSASKDPKADGAKTAAKGATGKDEGKKGGDKSMKPQPGVGTTPTDVAGGKDDPEAAKELVVDEPDPDSKVPGATRPRPADGDLVNLAKITRAAVVKIIVGDAQGNIKGTGSGFLISQDGLIATNHHVLKGAKKITAKLANGTAYPFTIIVAADAERDLAVFNIDSGGKPLPYLALDKSKGAEVGESVAVIGSPLGLEGTFSVGIVSSTRKNKETDMLQITAPISPGSSGSPVVDYDGTVVGIAVGAMEAGQSLNFAIAASELVELLSEKGKDTSSLELTGEDKPLNKRKPATLPESAVQGKLIEGPATIIVGGVPSNRGGNPNGEKNPATVSPGAIDPAAPSSMPKKGQPPVVGTDPKNPQYRIVEIGKKGLPDGNVELTLELRDASGLPAKLSSIDWKLNDKLPNGAVLKEGRLTCQIKEGDYVLSIKAVAKAGGRIDIKATMNVKIEVTSAVKINQSNQ